MGLYMSDISAKHVLRGVVREATRLVPPLNKLTDAALRVASKYNHHATERLVRELEKFFKPYAIICEHRRTGTQVDFYAYIPYFNETDRGWVLSIDTFKVRSIRGAHSVILEIAHGLSFAGHSLERLFQRARIVPWSAVKAELLDAVVAHHMWLYAYGKLGPEVKHKRVILPPTKSDGCFVGDYVYAPAQHDRTEGWMIVIKTFLKNSQYMNRVAERVKSHVPWAKTAKICKETDNEYSRIMLEILLENEWLLQPHNSSEEE